MSDSLAVAVIGSTLQAALRGEDQAWHFLVHPSESLQLWCGHLGLDMAAFCDKMADLQRRGDHAALQKAMRGFRMASVQLSRRGRRMAA
jgi:hypothetical protein